MTANAKVEVLTANEIRGRFWSLVEFTDGLDAEWLEAYIDGWGPRKAASWLDEHGWEKVATTLSSYAWLLGDEPITPSR